MTNTTINNNSYANFRAFEDNLICVKAMVFKKGKEAATVLCCVPREQFDNARIIIDKEGKKYPSSCGTFIRVVGNDLMSPNSITSLTQYERYLKKEGWKFAVSVKFARGKTKCEAFGAVKGLIDTLRDLKKF